MKKILLIVLTLAVFLTFGLDVFAEENGTVTVREWLDSEGGTTGLMIVYVREILNPVWAVVEDETGSVNLFGVTADGEFQPFENADIREGDVLLLRDPHYNMFDGTVEMTDAVLLRRISWFRSLSSGRAEADQYEFTASADEETEVRDLIFDGDVTVTGEGEAVYFRNCEFRGNVINEAATRTVVWIMPDCEFDEGAHCIIRSGVREADIDYSIPKIATCVPVEAECEDLGGIIAGGLFDIVMNGRTFSAADAEYYQTGDGDIVLYEEGMEASAHVVIHWWENGEEVVFTMAAQ